MRGTLDKKELCTQYCAEPYSKEHEDDVLEDACKVLELCKETLRAIAGEQYVSMAIG